LGFPNWAISGLSGSQKIIFFTNWAWHRWQWPQCIAAIVGLLAVVHPQCITAYGHGLPHYIKGTVSTLVAGGTRKEESGQKKLESDQHLVIVSPEWN
jgi:hypothetical protein